MAPQRAGRIIGFDLDMTLVNSSEAMAVALRVVNSRLGTAVDVEACVAALGAPVRDLLARWVPAERLDEAARVLADAFVADGLPLVRALPGAGRLLARLRAEGARTVVATTRRPRIAAACLRWCGLEVDELVGGLTSDGKTAVLRTYRVDCYVGDHPLDMAAAVRAGVPGFGVTTGFHDTGQLTAAGASRVLASLAEFPESPVFR